MSEPLVKVNGLRLYAAAGPIIDGVDLEIGPGAAVAVVGASGSGKTTLALACLGRLRDGIWHAGGTVTVDGRDVLRHRPDSVGYVGQDPGSSLNPYRKLRATVRSAAGLRGPVDHVLRRAGLDPALGDRRPAELSGGQQQRGALAVALSRNPRLLVLDEPTSALDPRAVEEFRAELGRLRADGVALLWITHDIDSTAGLVDQIVVLDAGRVVEHRPAADVLTRPESPAAAALVAAVAQPGPRPEPPLEPPILRARRLQAGYAGRRVLDGVDLELRPGRCLTVVGSSGSGKTTLARCLAGLHRPEGGELLLDGTPLASSARRRPTRQRAAIQLVPQNPADTLHPGQQIQTALVRPLKLLRGITDRTELAAEIDRLLGLVGLPVDHARRLPGEISGGQRQRVAIARALAAGPRVLICDEVTSALDSVTRAAVLDLLRELCATQALAVLSITHDNHVVRRISDDVLTLENGTFERPAADRTPADAICVTGGP
ncbi:peptide/nickel transport system ATP-binding protein [Micromonospora sp. Llam0]|uniref:ABC transporter ATP-binding protein n=1 Tax=Micromonospora sp. Llam0 TaxID=2485143 RepID=UPI000F470A1B|nr:ATP-binding cassette domain-containing protein [Micromonospora sp. Llam0]ROO60453.1 peptide/nickel transport system ATP-binding protein [Micromonospora sp. Llam0]